MRRQFIAGILLITIVAGIKAQTKAELEEQRKRALEEISYVDKMLKTTAKEKNESLQAIRIIGNKVNLRESVIRGMNEEMQLLNERIEINRLALEMMEEDIEILKKDYGKSVVNSYKYKKVNPDIVYILSARDFNQGYKRIKYLQQITKFRRIEAETIRELKQQVQITKTRLENDLLGISELRKREIQQKDLLKSEQNNKERMVKSLGTREKQLKRELDDKRRIARRIEAEIEKVIEEERRNANKSELTPEQRLIGENFQDNKGRLPWPVEKGIVTAHFGIQQHPVLKYVTEENKGIEITSSGKVTARSVFKGEVSAISAIAGANITVIIRHGNYLSVYSNLINVKVRKGEKVEIKQEVGDVYSDPRADNNCILKFMIFEQKNALDPEQWITKI
ncbi:MAG TPA: hypothetical protein DDW27_17075 [Bacteroidales bacterium]|nr:hypothetical protein [Bacteroidales bacterium]